MPRIPPPGHVESAAVAVVLCVVLVVQLSGTIVTLMVPVVLRVASVVQLVVPAAL